MIPSESTRIVLLGNDPADQQWSVLDYGTQLQAALARLMGTAWQITLCAPDTCRGSHWLRRWRVGRALAMYGSRYLVYPRLLKRQQGDLFHLLDHGNAWLIRFLDPARTVVFCHDLIPLIFRRQAPSDRPGLTGQARSLWPWLSARAFDQAVAGMRRAAAILVNSPCTQRDLVTHLGYPADQISVTALGLDPDLSPPAGPDAVAEARQAWQLPAGAVLLHVGHVVFYKNVEGILHGLQQLRARREPVWLVRAGPPMTPAQRRLARQLGIQDRIMEVGPVSRERLRLLYHAADCLVHPSWYEGLGLTVLEAMACGLPVVVSNRGALPETVGEAGLLVDPEQPARLADAVQALLQDAPLREQLRQRGLARAAQFTWEATAQRTAEVYRTLLAGTSGARSG